MAEFDIHAISIACYICETPFAKRQGQNKYCSEACRRENERRYRLRKRSSAGMRIAGDKFSCKKCGKEAIVLSGGSKFCSECSKIRRAETYKAHRLRHPEKRSEIQAKVDQRRRSDPSRIEKMRVYQKRSGAKRTANPKRNLDHRMSAAISAALKGMKAGRSWESIVGYSLDALVRHLERQFVEGMTWDNIGKWHIDHIRPKSLFRYEDAANPEFRDCWALTNLRPLWSVDNISKSNKSIFLI